MMQDSSLGPVRDIGGGWQLSFRTIELFGDVTAVPVIRPAGGAWIEMAPETLDGMARWSGDMRQTMNTSVELMNDWRAEART
ncbi:hypothetical protein [Rhodococcus ruber]